MRNRISERWAETALAGASALALAGALLVLAICLRLRRKYREIVDSVMHARRR